MKVMYISNTEADRMNANNHIYTSPIQAQAVADRLNYRFDTDEFVVVRAEKANDDFIYGYAVVSSTTM